jgi:hypothetical protein
MKGTSLSSVSRLAQSGHISALVLRKARMISVSSEWLPYLRHALKDFMYSRSGSREVMLRSLACCQRVG